MADTKVSALTELTTFSGDETFYVVEDDDGTPVSRRVTLENLATGIASYLPNTPQWTLVVDEDGTSIANWTNVAGTWAADAGGYIKQTDTTAAYRGLRLTANVYPGAAMIAQADVRFPNTATTGRRAMLGLCGSAAVSGNEPWAGLQENTDASVIQRGNATATTNAMTVNEDQWYTLRVAMFGEIITVYVDGTAVQTLRVLQGSASETSSDKFTLINFTGEVHYKSIKVWRLDGPD